MSTSLLYHGFDVKGYDYVRTKYQEEAVIFTLRPKRFELRSSSAELRTQSAEARSHVFSDL